MKRYIKGFTSFVLMLLLVIGLIPSSVAKATSKNENNFVRGVDVSTLDMLEKLGANYYSNGRKDDALKILRDNGANYVRLKLWVDPYDEKGNPYGGGNNDFATTLRLAKRAKALGMNILLDFHYSDFWADPANQIKPKAWSKMSFNSLKTTIYNYTRDTLNAFAKEGVYPSMVQIGNEISSGILHKDGKVGDGQSFNNLGELLGFASKGVRASADRNAKIVIHLDQGGKNQLYKWYFDSLLKANPNLDFDVIGLSYYPMWHGTMEGLQYNLNYLVEHYNKEVCIVETAYAWTTQDYEGSGNVFIAGDEKVGGYPPTVDGQIQFMNDLKSIIYNVPNNKGLGFFYWEPEFVPVKGGTYATSAGVKYKHDTVTPSNTWENMTLFDFKGNALPSMCVLNKPSENKIYNEGFEIPMDSVNSDWKIWIENGDTSTVKSEYGYAYEGEYKCSFWNKNRYKASIYKTFTNLPNGTYQFSVEAKSSGKQKTLQLYAKNYGGREVTKKIGVCDVNWNRFTLQNIKVTNHTCEIGIYTDANGGDWANFDSVSFRKIN